MTDWDGPGLEAWDAWRPEEVAARLRGVHATWCVIGGWSIDCFLGRETRPHEDLEIAVLAPQWPVVRAALEGLVLHAVADGAVRRLGPGEALPPTVHQSWALDVVAERWRVDVMVEPGDADTWVYRRDPSLTAPRSFMVGRTDDGIPHLLPHGALLFKAKAVRSKDDADLASVLPELGTEERAWLRAALRRFHPAHVWLDRLG